MFRRMNELLAKMSAAIDADLADFEREALADAPDGSETTTTVSSERRNGVLVTVTKTVRTVRRVTR